MTRRLVDLADEDHDLQLNSWNWGAIIRIIERTGIIDSKRIEMMDNMELGLEISKEESRQIAAHLRDRLAGMNPGERILWDGSVTAKPNSGEFHEDPRDDFSALYHVLQDVAQFLDECNGFMVWYF